MAGNFSHRRPAGTVRAQPVAMVLFVAFLGLVFIGLQPFAERELLAIATGEGDLARQASYCLIFLVCAGLALAWKGAGILVVPPRSLFLVLLWCLLSAVWSVAPWITLRRAALTGIVALTVFWFVEMLGPRLVLAVLHKVLALVLVVNFASILLVPHAVHLPGEADAALVGNWRGLYFHKNIAGPVAALSAILFLSFALESRRRIDWLLFAAAVAFCIGTRSKSAIGILAAVVTAGYLYRSAEAFRLPRSLFVSGLLLLLLTAIGVTLLYAADLLDWLKRPETLTGRGAIWTVVIESVQQRPFMGVGFGAFWQSGDASPVWSIAPGSWLVTVGHSHNGYLELLASIGLVGLGLALFSFLVVPLRAILSFDRRLNGMGFLLFCWIFFLLLLNLTEARFLERDRPEWVIFLVVVALVHNKTRARWVHADN